METVVAQGLSKQAYCENGKEFGGLHRDLGFESFAKCVWFRCNFFNVLVDLTVLKRRGGEFNLF